MNCSKDRSCSPILLESGLKSFLGHNYPLINGNNKANHGHNHHHNHHHHNLAIKDLTTNGGALGGSSDNEKSKDDNELWYGEAQTAFLGPNLWDKTYDTDLKYVDLDEFLSENGVSMDASNNVNNNNNGLNNTNNTTINTTNNNNNNNTSSGSNHFSNHHQQHHPHNNNNNNNHSQQQQQQHHHHNHHHRPLPKRERSPSPSDCLSPVDTLNPPSPADSTLSMTSSSRDFDPRTHTFSDDELKPQPMIKKSRKQFVPDNMKDDKYWARRRKNNMAAKRSRDARRMKENQIALRAGYLEKENNGLRQELERLKKENLLLRDKLSKCGDL